MELRTPEHKRRPLTSAAVAVAGLLMALLLGPAGCGSGGQSKSSRSPSQSIGTTTSASTASPLVTTENAAVSTVLAAIRSRDPGTLEALVRFTDRPCSLEATSLPGGPLCTQTETQGTVVSAFLVVGCPAAHWARASELPSLFDSMLPPGVQVHSVGLIQPQQTEAAYVVTLLAPAPAAQGSPPADAVRSLDVSGDGAVLGATFACPGVTPSAYLASRGITKFLLAPP